MRYTTLRLTAAALVAALPLIALPGCGAGHGPTHAPELDRQAERTSQDELVVDLEDGTTLAEFLARYPSLKQEDVRWNSPNVADEAIAVVRVSFDRQAELLKKLRADGEVESAENNSLVRLPVAPSGAGVLDASLANIPGEDPMDPLDGFPNDPLYGKQWNMEMVHARGAWRYATGEDVIVAVIDTGVAYENEKGLFAPDLEATKFVPGYDFVNDDNIAADDHGHGTHCAGTVAQSTNNGKGVIGLAPRARIMPLKVLSARGWGKTSDIADAIRFAADNGAHVISMSLGGGGYSRVLASACDYAADQGVAIVCAAGNGGRARVEYPAAYAPCVAVSSVGPSGKLAFYSSHGKELFIAAPGGDQRRGAEHGVLQNTLDPRRPGKTVYAYYQGTSMATPHVAAACALLYQSGVTRPDAQKSILARTAEGDGWNNKYGHGLLDAGAAVRHAIFVPSTVALLMAFGFAFVAFKRTPARQLGRAGVVLGALFASAGLFFLRPLGLGEVPVVGEFLCRGFADWDIALLGASWHWNALFASALIPTFLGVVSIPSRFTRSLGVGVMLGWAARLATGVVLPYADVRWVPGQGLLDGIWLVGNVVVLLLGVAAVIRLGKRRGSVSL
jgi:serine protease